MTVQLWWTIAGNWGLSSHFTPWLQSNRLEWGNWGRIMQAWGWLYSWTKRQMCTGYSIFVRIYWPYRLLSTTWGQMEYTCTGILHASIMMIINLYLSWLFYHRPFKLVISLFIPPFNDVQGGVYWFHLVCPGVHLRNLVRLRFVSSTTLAESIPPYQPNSEGVWRFKIFIFKKLIFDECFYVMNFMFSVHDTCSIWHVTLNYDPTHELDLGFSKSNFEIAVFQERMGLDLKLRNNVGSWYMICITWDNTLYFTLYRIILHIGIRSHLKWAHIYAVSCKKKRRPCGIVPTPDDIVWK